MSRRLTVAEVKEAVHLLDPSLAEFIGSKGEGLIDVCQALAVKLWIQRAGETYSTEIIRRVLVEYRNNG